ncbi:MAG: Phage integrase family protein [Phycisphaerales bacterium]|nr:Phage integrase family protein [Phycisphaerales bacterium]
MPRKKVAHASPIERFPTTARPDGRFQKRIRGRLHYFGLHGDRKTALAEYERIKHDLYAGRLPRAAASDDANTTVKELIYRFLDERLAEVKAGRANAGWYSQCRRAFKRFAKHVGDGRVIADLRPEDFAEYGRYLSQCLGNHAFNRELSSIKLMFRHANDCDWISRPIKFGRGFRKVAPSIIREERRSRLLDPTVIQLLLQHAKPQIKAMILLGLNGGYGAADCGGLSWKTVDLAEAIVRHYRRPKTLIDRDTPMWPETVAAIMVLKAKRPGDDLVFRTKYGKSWDSIAVAHEVKKLMAKVNALPERAELDPIEATLGDFRHTFYTYAGELGDGDAVKRVMGHKLTGLKETYTETIFIPRLRRVVEHVRHRIIMPPGP